MHNICIYIYTYTVYMYMYMYMYIYIMYISCDKQQNEDMVRNVEIPWAFRGLGCPRNGELIRLKIHQNHPEIPQENCHQFRYAINFLDKPMTCILKKCYIPSYP